MIKFLIDTASDIELPEAEKYGVELIPIEVRFNENVCYLDGINLTHKEFFEKLIESSELPKTSQINPYAFEEKFSRLVEQGYEVIAITLSSKLSGTYQNACIAAEKFQGRVHVVDSYNASIGERLLLEYGLSLEKRGLDAGEIKSELDMIKHDINLIALLNTLEYLKKGGRISSTAAVAGQLFSIKPVIGIINGEVKMLGKALGSKKGNNLLNRLAEEKGIDFSMPYGLVYSGLDETLLNKYLNDSSSLYMNQTNMIPRYMIGSTIGTHIGPGAIGVAFFGKENKND